MCFAKGTFYDFWPDDGGREAWMADVGIRSMVCGRETVT